MSFQRVLINFNISLKCNQDSPYFPTTINVYYCYIENLFGMYNVTIYPSTTFNKRKSEIGHEDRNMPFSRYTENKYT